MRRNRANKLTSFKENNFSLPHTLKPKEKPTLKTNN